MVVLGMMGPLPGGRSCDASGAGVCVYDALTGAPSDDGWLGRAAGALVDRHPAACPMANPGGPCTGATGAQFAAFAATVGSCLATTWVVMVTLMPTLSPPAASALRRRECSGLMSHSS